MKNIIVFILLSVAFVCNAQPSAYNSKSIELNNHAVEIFAKSNGDKVRLKEALVILDDAIKFDTSYYLAYQNKANVLCKLKKYDAAIKTLEKVIRLHKNSAEVLALQGFILEKSGKKKEATAKYQASFTAYERLIKESPNKVEYQVNQAFLLFFLVNKEASQKRIEEILKKYPENKSAKAILSLLNIFDRKQYLDTL